MSHASRGGEGLLALGFQQFAPLLVKPHIGQRRARVCAPPSSSVLGGRHLDRIADPLLSLALLAPFCEQPLHARVQVLALGEKLGELVDPDLAASGLEVASQLLRLRGIESCAQGRLEHLSKVDAARAVVVNEPEDLGNLGTAGDGLVAPRTPREPILVLAHGCEEIKMLRAGQLWVVQRQHLLKVVERCVARDEEGVALGERTLVDDVQLEDLPSSGPGTPLC
mmetsp:Transcript_20997/g.62098  ORF Transcript_20997/g.62098 Transcript_20997/m.62098 type:complete len:224 (-) Transcript_20997:637-1308(-)